MTLLDVQDLEVHFRAGGGLPLPGRQPRLVRAVNGISFTLAPGEALGLVGESGCGKSTLGRAILRLGEITGGAIRFGGDDIAEGGRAGLARLRRETAMIFQDPYNALNPRMAAGEAIAEVLRVHRKVPRDRVPARVAELLTLVGLGPEHASRRPAELSGGQCQRVGIARALAVEPKLIIADECVAALDVSIQAQIINLLIELKARMNLALIFIAHDLAVVRRLCDRVAVMYLGRIVEEGAAEAVFAAPQHPYTQALIRAIPEIDPDRALPADLLGGEPPSPLDLPPGCAFHPRCAFAMAECRAGAPPALRPVEGRFTACHLYPAIPARS
ncbi:ABC transporter ATP-binding protein [Inquilinus limosus]|uniref:ABC transporter ATP-binding protein n=1 Tax=Inquilinus limosus TaxID=171674 RepID=A0A211ZP45_9PROT|nr:ABC transporter ATP-binding protein [Inquilinus limosus]OWJ67058.1 ABC transporter ATP-binding protein [Inquilinus limosus]